MNMIQENNWVITIKKGKCKLTIFCGNVEQVITIYDIKALPKNMIILEIVCISTVQIHKYPMLNF